MVYLLKITISLVLVVGVGCSTSQPLHTTCVEDEYLVFDRDTGKVSCETKYKIHIYWRDKIDKVDM